MHTSRRELLTAGAGALAAVGLAGCGASPTGSDGRGGDEGAEGGGESVSGTEPANVAVAAEWNAIRARAWDALALGVAGEPRAGADVARNAFARFEGATGEFGAHEVLEHTSETTYAEFEEALGELRVEGLAAGDVGRAREEATIVDDQLAGAQRALVGETASRVLALQSLGAAVQDAAFLAGAGAFAAAGTVAEDVLARFEGAAVHDALESAAPEDYEAFEAALESVATAAGNADAAAVRTGAGDAFAAALSGSYAVADSEATAGAGHVAAFQARGWDAAALVGMGGPSTAYAHAAALTVYRARAYDARWLAAAGETEPAATVAGDVFAHFEGAKAHEALKEADREAYEGFEAGLEALRAAIEAGDAAGVDEAVAAVDSNLLAGVEALAGAKAPLLESAFFRARIADARERYRLGEPEAAASIAEGLFERFEANELDFHETVESTSEELYERFEEEHLSGLIEAFRNGDDGAVETHYEGVHSTLLEFETAACGEATVSGAEGGYVAARGFDAAVLDALGDDGRAAALARGAFEHFEAGAGGYHEALEHADEATYEAFEDRLGAVATAADDGADVYAASKAFNAEAVTSIYAIVGATGGSHVEAAAGLVQDVFADFEEARVHELLEEADRSAYHTFESTLETYVAALQEGGDVAGAVESFARACQYAQFALVDSVEELPLGLTLAGTAGGAGSGEDGGGDADLQGGPNVVEGVPEDADHVVAMQAVAFEPAELTIAAGKTVAWEHAAGEPHTVTADEADLPDGASYWASGGFESQEAAEAGWEEGEGAVQSGQSYVHTFETPGTYRYFCVPHEAAGMVGTVVVE